jgi:hypothetical protein
MMANGRRDRYYPKVNKLKSQVLHSRYPQKKAKRKFQQKATKTNKTEKGEKKEEKDQTMVPSKIRFRECWEQDYIYFEAISYRKLP